MATLRVGDTFRDGKAATYALQDYALSTKKRVVLDRGGGGHKRFKCSCDGCSFFVQLYQRKARGQRLHWYISSMQLEHINCTGVAKATTRQLRELASFRGAVLSNASISASALSENVQKLDGVVVTNRSTIYRAKDMVTRCIQQEKTQQFQKIPSILAQFQQKNEGSFTRTETDPDGRFRRAIVVSGVLVKSMPYNQQIVGIDCSQSRSQDYDGQQILVVGRDGNCGSVIIAAALVKNEDAENYGWAVECLREAGLSLASYPVVCGGCTNFGAVAPAFDVNVQSGLGLSSNLVESVTSSSLVLGLRAKSPYEFLDSIMEFIAENLRESAQLSAQWTAERRIVTPGAQRLYDEQQQQLGYYTAQMTTLETGLVWRVGQDPSTAHAVDVLRNTCACGFIEQQGVPCRHMMAALAKIGKMDSVFTRFAECYLVKSYTAAFGDASVVLPESSAARSPSVLPAKRKASEVRSPGAKHVRTSGEGSQARVQRCGTCKQVGHNRKRCPNSTPNSQTVTETSDTPVC